MLDGSVRMGLDTRPHRQTSEQGSVSTSRKDPVLGQVETDQLWVGIQVSGLEGFLIFEPFIWSHKGESWGPGEPQSCKTLQSCSSWAVPWAPCVL